MLSCQCDVPVLTSQLTPWTTFLLKKLLFPQLAKKLPAFYEILRFITVLTTAHHVTLSTATWVQFTPSHHILFNIHFNITLLSVSWSSKWSLSFMFPPIKFFYAILFTPRCATCLLILLDLITGLIFGEYKSWSPTLCSFPHPAVIPTYTQISLCIKCQWNVYAVQLAIVTFVMLLKNTAVISHYANKKEWKWHT